jgi:DNA polymerase-3 subunit delta
VKFPSVFAFQKHLQEAFPSHLSLLYAIACPSEYERKGLIRSLTQLIQKKEPERSLAHFDGVTTSVEEVLGHLQSPSLFSPASLVVVDGIDKWKKAAFETLGKYLERPSPQTYLILGSNSSKPLADLYLKSKKEMVVLDLGDEKPWDRQKRLKEWLIQEVKKEKKILAPDVAEFLMQEIGTDFALLEQEIQKLLCFCMERPSISLSDAKTLLSARASQTSWQIAEGVVFLKKGIEGPEQKDLSFLLPLVGQIRYHLQMGFKVVSLLESGVAQGDLGTYISNVKNVDKYRGKPSSFYKRGLKLLFEWELKCKSTSLDPSLLFDHFTFKLHATPPA